VYVEGVLAAILVGFAGFWLVAVLHAVWRRVLIQQAQGVITLLGATPEPRGWTPRVRLRGTIDGVQVRLMLRGGLAGERFKATLQGPSGNLRVRGSMDQLEGLLTESLAQARGADVPRG
jgi:hypothetical protein